MKCAAREGSFFAAETHEQWLIQGLQKEQDKVAKASTVKKFGGLGRLNDTDRSACFIAIQRFLVWGWQAIQSKPIYIQPLWKTISDFFKVLNI